jgi:D-serine deaminase-like pyridoxal phosphate-dependent protein
MEVTKISLDTPALCMDLDVMEANIEVMVQACRDNDIGWRPHSKCHKSAAIGQKLIEAGALGITCAKLGEAEVLGAGGIDDLLIANLIVGPTKLSRLARLCTTARPIVCIDHIDQAVPMSEVMTAEGQVVRVIFEVDIGLCRVGVLPGEPLLELAAKVAPLPGLELVGIMGYEGHLLTISDPAEKEAKIHQALGVLVDAASSLKDAGYCCDIVSCGGTGSYVYGCSHPGITEIQAGGAIMMDQFYRNQCNIQDLGNALTVLVTVVSRPTPGRAIIDAGRKTFHADSEPAVVVGRDDIHVVRLSAEHGELELEPSAQDLKIGDRLEIIPGYSDMTTVLHDQFYGFRGDYLEVIWPLEGRGRLQ